MQAFLKKINSALEFIFKSNTALNKAGSHLCVSSSAKRVRPLLTIYFANTLNVPAEDIFRLAIASELIHSASLLHDDVIDDSTVRRGIPTVNIQWNNSVAILSGNYLLVKAFDQLKGFPPSITWEAMTVINNMTEGAMLEISMRDHQNYHNIDNWKTMVTGKTGSLFSFCGTSVALYCGNSDAVTAFKIIGQHIGQIFQLIDELQDVLEDSKNLESTYINLVTNTGYKDPISLCRKELAKQIEFITRTIDPWKSTIGGKQIITWLEKLTDFNLL